MKEVFSASECFIAIKLDMHTIQDLHLDVNVHTVRHSILKGSFGETRPRVLRDLKPQHVVISGGGHKVRQKSRQEKTAFPIFGERLFVLLAAPVSLCVKRMREREREVGMRLSVRVEDGRELGACVYIEDQTEFATLNDQKRATVVSQKQKNRSDVKGG